jgi:hypothetical protein
MQPSLAGKLSRSGNAGKRPAQTSLLRPVSEGNAFAKGLEILSCCEWCGKEGVAIQSCTEGCRKGMGAFATEAVRIAREDSANGSGENPRSESGTGGGRHVL